MDLTKYGQGYLTEGIYKVKVVSKKLFTANSGTKGVDFAVADRSGATSKVGFMLTEKAMFRLGSFAGACGLSEEEMQNYDHDMLIGKYVKVRIVRDGGYHKVDTDQMGWWKYDEGPDEETFTPSPKPPEVGTGPGASAPKEEDDEFAF